MECSLVARVRRFSVSLKGGQGVAVPAPVGSARGVGGGGQLARAWWGFALGGCLTRCFAVHVDRPSHPRAKLFSPRNNPNPNGEALRYERRSRAPEQLYCLSPRPTRCLLPLLPTLKIIIIYIYYVPQFNLTPPSQCPSPANSHPASSDVVNVPPASPWNAACVAPV